MENKNFVKSWVTIENNSIKIDGSTIFSANNTDFAEFSKKAYYHLEVNYTKFFKMDNLSKLAFLASELILNNESDENNIALLFSNKSGSLDIDVKFQNSISNKANYFPSPAVFVYTLPNICLGEISIRHQLKTENTFFIFDAFNAQFMHDYANILIDTGKANQVLCGWVEYYQENYKAFLYLVSNQGIEKHSKLNLEKLYTE